MCLLVEYAKLVQETKEEQDEEGTQTIIAMQLGVTRPTKPKQKN